MSSLNYDTTRHSFEVLAKLPVQCRDILVDVEFPIVHASIRYNCRVIFYDGIILFIRPKVSLADDGKPVAELPSPKPHSIGNNET